MTPKLSLLPRSLALCGLLALAGGVAATPMRVSVDGLAAPDIASAAANDPPPAQFVPAGPPVLPEKDDLELPLVRSQDLPSAAQAAPADAAAAADAHSVPDESVALGREAREPVPTDDGAAESDRRLGGFAGLAQQAADVPAALAVPRPEADLFELLQAEPASLAPPEAATPLPSEDDLERLREQRQALQWVVVPLVLAAMAIAWFTSRRQRPTQTRRESQHRQRRRSRRVVAAPPSR